MSTQTDLGADNERLRALVQELVDASSSELDYECGCRFCARLNNAIAAAKEQGFTPTNTEDK